MFFQTSEPTPFHPFCSKNIMETSIYLVSYGIFLGRFRQFRDVILQTRPIVVEFDVSIVFPTSESFCQVSILNFQPVQDILKILPLFFGFEVFSQDDWIKQASECSELMNGLDFFICFCFRHLECLTEDRIRNIWFNLWRFFFWLSSEICTSPYFRTREGRRTPYANSFPRAEMYLRTLTSNQFLDYRPLKSCKDPSILWLLKNQKKDPVFFEKCCFWFLWKDCLCRSLKGRGSFGSEVTNYWKL